MKGYILLLTFVSLLSQSIYSQNQFQDRIKNFDDICYCQTGLTHPMRLLSLDNNYDIVNALKSGLTLKQLDRSGIKYTDSQIRLLQYSRIIKRKDSVYYSLTPIIPEQEAVLLRKETKRMATEIVPLFKDDFESLMETLNSKGLQRNSYSLFFAYVLDEVVWNILENDSVIDRIVITQEEPFWDGAYWLIEPKRDFSCGRNSLESGVYSINVNWSHASKVEVSNYTLLNKFLDDYIANGKVTSPEVYKEFLKNDLFDKNGQIKIPVIKTVDNDIIYMQSKAIAQTVVDYLNKFDYSLILPDHKYLPKSTKLIILYHEMMWDILQIMEANGQLKKPIAFDPLQEAKDEDLKDLIYIVKK